MEFTIHLNMLIMSDRDQAFLKSLVESHLLTTGVTGAYTMIQLLGRDRALTLLDRLGVSKHYVDLF